MLSNLESLKNNFIGRTINCFENSVHQGGGIVTDVVLDLEPTNLITFKLTQGMFPEFTFQVEHAGFKHAFGHYYDDYRHVEICW